MNSRATIDGPFAALSAHVRAFRDRAAETEAVAALAPGPDDHVLAVGFGPGVGVARLAERITRGRLAGVDPSARMLHRAGRRIRRLGADGRVELRRGTCVRLPWPDGRFDGVLSVNTLPLWEPFDVSAREVARVLRTGGRFVSYTRQGVLRRVAAGGVEDWVRQVGEVFTASGFTNVHSWRGRAESGRIVALTATRV